MTAASFTDRELTLERLMAEMGAQRYQSAVLRARERGRETSTAPGRMLLGRACTAMTTALEEWVLKETSRTGRPSQAAMRLVSESPELLATLTCKVVLDSLSIRRTFGATARAIAAVVEDEARFKHFQAELPLVWKKLQKNFRNADGYASKRRKVLKTMRNLGTEWPSWGPNERIRVGIVLLDLFITSTELVRTEEVAQRGSPKRKLYLVATQETLKWLEGSHEAHEAMYPFYLPMLQPPTPWTSLFDGGYATNLVRQVPLIKARTPQAIIEAEDADLGEVFECINTLQHTPWEVNQDVYQVALHFWEASTPIADLPDREDLPLPPKPATIDTDEDARLEWRRGAAIIYDANVSARSRRVQSAKILFMARQFDGDRFYFPYTCDFRGRIYPVPYFLQPQGPSLARGLLRFADGKPIGSESNAKLFLVHGANMFGYDKASLTERAAWVLEHEVDISAVYEDPIANRWWAEADKPWEFLAFCLEFAEWRLMTSQGIGHLFISKIPVAMDGSNNGLQVFSLLLRDERGGAATNCTPSDFPQDIYQEVADRVTEQLLTEKDPTKVLWAKGWLKVAGGAIPRSCTKRPVMTLPYGSTKFSCQRYILDWYDEVAPDAPFGKLNYPAAWYLTELVWSAIESVVVSARSAMTWLQNVARIANKLEKPILWTSPSGFPVRQAYNKGRHVTVETAIGDRVRHTRIIHDTDKIDGRRQVNGISPNFVHSLDAAALVKTVTACGLTGIESYAMVHDSFGCLAGDSTMMAQTLRDQYAQMFTPDLLADFRDQVQTFLGVDLPPLPPYGSLDPEVLRDSDYFFA